MIEKNLAKQSPAEMKLSQEIEKLTKRLGQLHSERDKVRHLPSNKYSNLKF